MPDTDGVFGFDEALLARVRAIVAERTRVDFGAYRDGTVRRRLRNRMAHLAVDSPAAYVERLESDRIEADRLLEHVLVKVSRFHRCTPTFRYVAERVLPELAHAAAGRPLRILCMGCGRGEEPWTFAMLLEAAGIPGTVIAADVDSAALFATARATYPESALVELPAALRDRCLEPVERSGQILWRIRPELRARVRVELRDVLHAPVPKRPAFDLVSCRNVLIYLSAAAQVRALGGLLASVREHGVLLLGEAEWPPRELAARLLPLAPRLRVFRRREAPERARGCSA